MLFTSWSRICAGQFGDQLRAFVLKPHAALTKCRGGSHVAGDDGAGGGEYFAGFELDAGLRQFCFDGRAVKANRQCGLVLAVAADCARASRP